MISRDTDPIRDPVLDEEAVLSLVRRHVLDAKALTGVDESGGEARAYVIDDHLILNTQRPHRVRPRTSLEKYAFFLDQLASDPEIAVPQKLGYGRKGGVEYLCMTRIPGVAMRYLTLEGPARMEALRTLGKTLRRIHRVPQVPFVESGLFPGDRSHADLVARLEASFAGAVEAVTTSELEWHLDLPPEAVAANVLAALPRSVELVALHANPGPVHTFVDPQTGRYTGLIDFGDAYISHPALDLRQWSEYEDREALLEGYTAEYPIDDTFMATWRVTMILGAMMAMARRPDGRAEAEQNIRQLLAEL